MSPSGPLFNTSSPPPAVDHTSTDNLTSLGLRDAAVLYDINVRVGGSDVASASCTFLVLLWGARLFGLPNTIVIVSVLVGSITKYIIGYDIVAPRVNSSSERGEEMCVAVLIRHIAVSRRERVSIGPV